MERRYGRCTSNVDTQASCVPRPAALHTRIHTRLSGSHTVEQREAPEGQEPCHNEGKDVQRTL
jgi:hypothetical protein